MARIILDVPEQVTYWELMGLELRKPRDPVEHTADARVIFIMENDQGETWRHPESGETAWAILQYVNTADFSGTNLSLYERALQWLVDNGVVDGMVGGDTL